MSDENTRDDIQPADQEPDIWDNVGRSSVLDGAHAEDAVGGGPAIGGEFGTDEHVINDFVDADAKHVPAPRSKLVPKALFALVVLGVVGVAGSGVYNLYRKIVPATGTEAAVNVQEEVVRTPEPVEPSLAGQAAASPGTTIGMQPAEAASPPVQVAEPAASAPSASSTVTSAAVHAVATPAAAPASAVAAVAPPAVVLPAVVPPAAEPVVIASKAPTTTNQPANGNMEGSVPPQGKPSATAVPAPDKAAAEAAAASKRAEDRKARREERLKAAEVARAQRAEKAAARAAEKAARRAAAKATEQPAKARVAKATWSRPAPTRAKPREVAKTDITDIALGVIKSHKIESISPRHGEFQMAWVRNMAGKLAVVAAGDTLDGMRVLQVDATKFTVRTNQGEIR